MGNSRILRSVPTDRDDLTPPFSTQFASIDLLRASRRTHRGKGPTGDTVVFLRRGRASESSDERRIVDSLMLGRTNSIAIHAWSDTIRGQLKKLEDRVAIGFLALPPEAPRATTIAEEAASYELNCMHQQYQFEDINGHRFTLGNGEYLHFEQQQDSQALAWSVALPARAVGQRVFQLFDVDGDSSLDSVIKLADRRHAFVSTADARNALMDDQPSARVRFVRLEYRDGLSFTWRAPRHKRDTTVALGESGLIASSLELDQVVTVVQETATPDVASSVRQMLSRTTLGQA